MEKIIIAGGRKFNDYNFLQRSCTKAIKAIKGKKDIEIVSGTAQGADLLGERFAIEKGYPIKRFPADWATFPKAGGIIRNGNMARYANRLIAFWDGKSRGTDSMIELARKYKLKILVVRY